MSAQDIGEKYDILRLLIMSIPFYTILCTSCDFNDGYSYGILYEYQGPDDHEPALQLAWCQDCDKIVSVCSPYTQELAGEMIANLQKEIAWNRAGFFARFSKRKRHAIEEAEHKIEITRKRVCYFESIIYKNKCLSCGQADVFPFQIPRTDFREFRCLDVTHSCGGELMIVMEGRLSFKRRPRVVYNENGKVIHDERVNLLF